MQDFIQAGLTPDSATAETYRFRGITSQPSIVGTVQHSQNVAGLTGHFHGAGITTSVLHLVDAEGSFVINSRELERIWGAPLDDGLFVLRLAATDHSGAEIAYTDVVFTLDTTPPAQELFEPRPDSCTAEQRGFIDASYRDVTGVDPNSVGPNNIQIKNGGKALRVRHAETTQDGFYRYHYEGELVDGEVTVTFLKGEIRDLAGNYAGERKQTFNFLSKSRIAGLVPQRAARMQMEPRMNPPHNQDSGGSVYLHSGEAFLRRTDLKILGRGLDFSFERIYRSGWLASNTPLGKNWDFNYNRRLVVLDSNIKLQQARQTFPNAHVNDVVRVDGVGRVDLYEYIEFFRYTSPRGLYTTLQRDGERFVERDRDGTTVTYTAVDGVQDTIPMVRIADRNNNTMQFLYHQGKLQTVIDTLGRRIQFLYTGDLLTRVRDYSGREVQFTYDEFDCLRAATGPRVVGTPHGNDFPEGKTEEYTYETHPATLLNRGNLLTVTAPNEVACGGPPREVYVYDENGRVVEHACGGTNSYGVPAGGTFTYRYLHRDENLLYARRRPFRREGLVDEQGEVAPVRVPTTIVTDRQGNITFYEFSGLGNWTQILEATNRNVRGNDPPYFRERHSYDDDGQRLTVTYHEGNSMLATFDQDNIDPRQRGNLLETRRQRDGRRGADQSELRTTYSYEPIYNQVRRMTDPRGYTTTYTFDYQEGTNYAGLATKLGTTEDEVQSLLERAGTPMGLGDVNGDGRTGQINGNIVRVDHPVISRDADLLRYAYGAETQDMRQLFSYNDFGQMVRQTDAEGNVTTYDYYSEDPGVLGVLQGLGQTSIATGYLRQMTRDAVGGSDRNSGADPPPCRIRTSYEYDSTGNIIRQVDGRGVVTEYFVNQLNQIVQTTRAANVIVNPFGGGVAPGIGPTGPPLVSPLHTFKYLERYWYDFNDNLVLDQVEDRGNTSAVEGSLPEMNTLPIGPVLIDFSPPESPDTFAYEQHGFFFKERTASTGQSSATDGSLRMATVLAERGGGESGIKLSSSSSMGFTLRRRNGGRFSLGRVHVTGLATEGGQWVIESSEGAREVLRAPDILTFTGPKWRSVSWIELVPDGDAGTVSLGNWEVYPDVDSDATGTAFADTAYKYDIMDNLIEAMQEVTNGANPHFIRTRYRYDANENLALTIYPEGNASTVLYDERDLPFRKGHGELMPEMNPIEDGDVWNPAVDPSLLVTSATWTTDEWSGQFVRIVSGKGSGQLRRIASNTRNILSVTPDWDDTPDGTSRYELGETFALLAPNDPIEYDVRGGISCSCSTYTYDGNRNVVTVVDADGHTSRNIYDHFDRLTSSIDGAGDQVVYQYDAAGNTVRELRFGSRDGQGPAFDQTVLPASPVSTDGVVEAANLVSDQLLAATEFGYDEASRVWRVHEVLFINSSPTIRAPDVTQQALDVGKWSIGPDLTQAIPGVIGITVLGRTTRWSIYDRKSRLIATVEDDGDTSLIYYDGADRITRRADPEGNTIEFWYDDNHNIVERRDIELSLAGAGAGALDGGTSTGENTARTLNDGARSWHAYEWAGRSLEITDGAGAGQTRTIVDNGASQLITDSDWDILPDSSSVYSILPVQVLSHGQSTGFNTISTLNDAHGGLAIADWAGRWVEVTGGVGAGQIRRVAESNAFQLFVEPPWTAIPDETSAYRVTRHARPQIADSCITTFSYDSLNRLERRVDNLGHATYYRHDSRDNVVAVADAQGPDDQEIQRRAFTGGSLTANLANGYGNVSLYYYDGINRRVMQEVVMTASGSGDGVHIGASVEGIKSQPLVPESFAPPADPGQGGGDGLLRSAQIYDDNSLVACRIDDRGCVSVYLHDNQDRCVAESGGAMVDGAPLTAELLLGSRSIVTPTQATIDDPRVIATEKIDDQLARAQARLDRMASLFPAGAGIAGNPTTTTIGFDARGDALIVEDSNGSRSYILHDQISRPIALRVFRAGQADSHVGDPIFAPNPVAPPSDQGGTALPTIGTNSQDFVYDGLSRLVGVADNNDPLDAGDDSHVAIAYDSLSRVLEEQQQCGASAVQAVSSGWRSSNLRSSLTYPNGRTVRFTYDGLDRIGGVSDDGGPLVVYRYIGPHRVVERLCPGNGTRLTCLDASGQLVGYDGSRRQTELRHLRADNSLVVGFTYRYDREHSKLSQLKLHAPGDSEVYGYDSYYQLKEFSRGTLDGSGAIVGAPSPNVPAHSRWEIDGAGNWTAVDVEARDHSSHNELISRHTAGGPPEALTYDSNGNLVDDGSTTFAWDALSRLCEVRRKADSQVVARYFYDAFGRRVSKVVTNSDDLDASRVYYLDGIRVIEEHDGAEQLSQQYVHGNYVDEVIITDRDLDGDGDAVGPGNQRLFLHQCNLMHVYALSDDSGNVVEGYLYDAYGQHTVFRPGPSGVVEFGGQDDVRLNGRSMQDNSHMFTGRSRDEETGLLYYRSRYYAPSVGRFVSRDPSGTWTDTMNLGNGYSYVRNSPINWLDPLGLAAEDWDYFEGDPFIDASGNSCRTQYRSRSTVVNGDEAIEVQELGTDCEIVIGPERGTTQFYPISGLPSAGGGSSPLNDDKKTGRLSDADLAFLQCMSSASMDRQACHRECNRKFPTKALRTGTAMIAGATGGAAIGFKAGGVATLLVAGTPLVVLAPIIVGATTSIGAVAGTIVGWVNADTPGDCENDCDSGAQNAMLKCGAMP